MTLMPPAASWQATYKTAPLSAFDALMPRLKSPPSVLTRHRQPNMPSESSSTNPLNCLDQPMPCGPLPRRLTKQVKVQWADTQVLVGGDAPVVVQSMTNTDTADAIATAVQVRDLAFAGSEVVRITVNSLEAAREVPAIREQLDKMGCPVPLVGDFHFNGHKLLAEVPECATALSKYRINPGNVGRGAKRDSQFGAMIEAALRFERPIRIGVNWGSLDQELLARLMDENGSRPEPWDAQAVMREALVSSALQS